MEPLEVKDVPKVKPSIGLFHWYAFSLGLGAIQVGFAIGGNSQTGPVFAKKYGWDDSNKRDNLTLVGTIAVAGLACGSILASFVIVKGRRLCILMFNCLVMIGVLFAMTQSLFTLCLGRFIHGIAAGVLNICMSVYMSESVTT